MPESNQIVFTHKELAELLVKNQDIHEGLWGVFIEFGFNAANVSDPTGSMQPAAIVPVLKVGIQKFPAPNSLTVDAAQVNPPSPESPAPNKPKPAFTLDRQK